MLLTEYLTEIAGTAEEKEFFESFDQPEMIEAFEQSSRIPFVGKLTSALVTLVEMKSIAEFELHPQFDHLKGWEIRIDEESGGISIVPGPKQRKVIFAVIGAIVAVIIGLIVWRKLKKRR